MAADKNNNTILNGKNAEIDDSALDQVSDLKEDDLETQMAAALEEEGISSGGEDDLETQMAATMALEPDSGDFDLESQMTSAMEEGELGGIGDALDMGEMEDESAVAVQPLEFPQLHPADESVDSESIDRLLDVSLSISVELGRKQMQIKEILGLGPGKIIELDKLAGEPVDLLVNGKLLAKGEVVVVDENFGVRITDLINPKDRIKML